MSEIARRSMLLGTGVVLLGGVARAQSHEAHGHEPQAVTPTEDLMQEHGLLDRALLIYEETLRRIAAGHGASATALHRTAQLVQQFVHEYHEQNEEHHLFPRAQTNATLAPTITTLLAQHQRGRALTATIVAGATDATLADAAHRSGVTHAMEAFIRMYRPHAAREDTFVFPAVRDLFSAHDWHELGERFEEDEHRRFGTPGFEGMVEQIADIERSLGIFDLGQFTPT